MSAEIITSVLRYFLEKRYKKVPLCSGISLWPRYTCRCDGDLSCRHENCRRHKRKNLQSYLLGEVFTYPETRVLGNGRRMERNRLSKKRGMTGEKLNCCHCPAFIRVCMLCGPQAPRANVRSCMVRIHSMLDSIECL